MEPAGARGSPQGACPPVSPRAAALPSAPDTHRSWGGVQFRARGLPRSWKKRLDRTNAISCVVTCRCEPWLVRAPPGLLPPRLAPAGKGAARPRALASGPPYCSLVCHRGCQGPPPRPRSPGQGRGAACASGPRHCGASSSGEGPSTVSPRLAVLSSSPETTHRCPGSVRRGAPPTRTHLPASEKPPGDHGAVRTSVEPLCRTAENVTRQLHLTTRTTCFPCRLSSVCSSAPCPPWPLRLLPCALRPRYRGALRGSSTPHGTLTVRPRGHTPWPDGGLRGPRPAPSLLLLTEAIRAGGRPRGSEGQWQDRASEGLEATSKQPPAVRRSW